MMLEIPIVCVWGGGNPVFLTHQALFYHMDIKPRYSSVFVL